MKPDCAFNGCVWGAGHEGPHGFRRGAGKETAPMRRCDGACGRLTVPAADGTCGECGEPYLSDWPAVPASSPLRGFVRCSGCTDHRELTCETDGCMFQDLEGE